MTEVGEASPPAGGAEGALVPGRMATGEPGESAAVDAAGVEPAAGSEGAVIRATPPSRASRGG